MPDTSAAAASELRELARQLLAIADAIHPEKAVAIPPVRSAEDVERLVSARICLNCGEKVADGDAYRRGLDTRCYQLALRRGVPDKELVAAGLMAPATTGGRPPTKPKSAIDGYIAAKAKTLADGLKAENTKAKKKCQP